MPTLSTGTGNQAVDIFYEVREGGASTSDMDDVDPPCLLMIMGFAATLECWDCQLDQLLQTQAEETAVRVCLMDNRGVGRSSSPIAKTAYSTSIMAADCIALLDELKWRKVHVIGHSMGGMIATMLAAQHPQRVHTLTLISVTAGRWQSIPTSWAAIKYAWQTFWASSIEERAKVDLKFHFMKKTLNEVDRKYKRTRRSLLHDEYVEGQKGGGIGQPDHGFKGQVYAVWTHSVTDQHVAAIKSGDFPIMVIHGRYDILAHPKYGEQLATRLECPCMMLEGAHFVTREAGPEINLLLKHMIYHGQRAYKTRRKYLDAGADKQNTVQNGEIAVEAVTLQLTE